MALKSRDHVRNSQEVSRFLDLQVDFQTILNLDNNLGFSKEEIDQILSQIPDDSQKISSSDKLKEKEAKFLSLVTELHELLERSIDYVQIWLRSPNPQLGGRTALSYLLEGKIEVVEGLVYAMNTGQPI